MKRLAPFISFPLICVLLGLAIRIGIGPAIAQTAPAPATQLPTLNVLGFGAKGDGTTDDSAAIQTAANALPWGGGTLYFPGHHNYFYKAPIAIRGKVGTKVIGDSGRAGGNPYGPGERNLLSVLTGPGFVFTGSIDNEVRDLVFSGSADGSVASPIGVQFLSGGFGCTRNAVRHCAFWYVANAIQLGGTGDVNGDNFLCQDCQFTYCLNAVCVQNSQAVSLRFERIIATYTRTILDLQQGGVAVLNGICVGNCGDMCPISAAHPKADLANDWMIRLGVAGPDNELVTIQDFFIDGAAAASSQLIATTGTGGHQIVVRDCHQSLVPNGNPLVSLVNSSIVFEHSSFRGANFGTLVNSKARIGWGSLVPQKVVADSKSSVSVEQ